MPGYDLVSLNLPKLSGTAIRLFAAALDNPATRAALLPSLLQQGGIGHLRELRLEGDPTFYPLAPSGEPPGEPLSVEQLEAAMIQAPTGPAPFATARDYAAAYHRGTTSPVEVAEKVLAAIEQSNAAQPPLRAFLASERADVLAQARASSGRIREGRALGPLDGVPVAIKDEVDQAPYPTNAGTSYMGAQPATDSTVAARLRAAGALLVGKTVMNELGLDPCGFNAHFGTVRNPFDPARDPGGSSSGSAAAVAAGLCPLAIGCDGGGSVRIPAALCGQVGLKPTFGRVSEFGAAPLAPSVDAIGPIGASVADVALGYGLIAGPDPRDPRSQVQPAVRLAGWNAPGLHGLKLGVYWPWFHHAATEIAGICEVLLSRLEAAGAEVVEIEIPGLDAMRLAHVVSILGEQSANLQDHREHRRELGAPTRITLALTYAFTATDYIQAQRIRTGAIATFEKTLRQVDAILTPTTAITAPPIPPDGPSYGWSDLSTTTEKMRYAFTANLTGHPAISFPAGYDGDGLPVGMQAIGRYWDELTLLRIAYAAEQVVERRLPQVFYPIL